jgi:hypothetical protein
VRVAPMEARMRMGAFNRRMRAAAWSVRVETGLVKRECGGVARGEGGPARHAERYKRGRECERREGCLSLFLVKRNRRYHTNEKGRKGRDAAPPPQHVEKSPGPAVCRDETKKMGGKEWMGFSSLKK